MKVVCGEHRGLSLHDGECPLCIKRQRDDLRRRVEALLDDDDFRQVKQQRDDLLAVVKGFNEGRPNWDEVDRLLDIAAAEGE